MSCWRSFGAAEFLDSCLRGLIVLVACICRWLFVLEGWCLESEFFGRYEHSYNFYPAPTVNLGIDREGTAKSQDGQQKGILAHVKRKVATPLSMKVKPV